MMWAVSGASIPASLKYADPITRACAAYRNGFPPCFAYAIAWNETIGGEYAGIWTASTVVSPDGGHGLFQLTSPEEFIPQMWTDPYQNGVAAVAHWIMPDVTFWVDLGLSGPTLVRAVAASFNAGIGGVDPNTGEASGAYGGHLRHGDVDAFTTKSDGVGYGQRALNNYVRLIAGQQP